MRSIWLSAWTIRSLSFTYEILEWREGKGVHRDSHKGGNGGNIQSMGTFRWDIMERTLPSRGRGNFYDNIEF